MSYFVLIQEPKRKPLYISCPKADDCLEVVKHEIKTVPVGTRLTMAKDVPGRKHMEPVRTWKVTASGTQSYAMNSGDDSQVALMRHARNGYLHGGMSKAEVTKWLVEEHGASRDNAGLAAAAGLILARADLAAAPPGRVLARGDWYKSNAGKARTFAQARREIFEALRVQGWEIKEHNLGKALKTSYATKDGKRLYFKPQALYLGYGPPFNAGDARSLVDDIRRVDPQKLPKYVEGMME